MTFILPRTFRAGDPYAVPTNSEAAGLPPTLVLTCGRDYLRRQMENHFFGSGADIPAGYTLPH